MRGPSTHTCTLKSFIWSESAECSWIFWDSVMVLLTHDNGDKGNCIYCWLGHSIDPAVKNESPNPFFKALMHHGRWLALPLAVKVILSTLKVSEACAHGFMCVLVNLPDLLDPDAVVCHVQIIQYVGWVVLSEDFVNIQQAFEDTGFPWAQKHTVAGKWKNSVILAQY